MSELLPIGAVDTGLSAGPAAPTPAPAPLSGFADLFVQEAAQVNSALLKAEAGVRQLAAGEAPSLHEVMIRLDEARVSFQLLAQVRNRLLESYQEVMRMQV
jgi:flagellar hook-basal body complex protein FliE